MAKQFVVAVIRLNLWWLALFGSVSVLAGVAGLYVGKPVKELVGAGMETATWLALNLVATLIGLSYLLWRTGGRFNLSTLFGIVTGIALCLGAIVRRPSSAVAICLASLLLAIATCWPAIKKDLARR